MRKLVILFASLALAVASAKTYSVTLFQPASISGTELKAGEYKVDVQDSKVVIRSGKTQVEANVTVETAQDKFRSTVVRFEGQSNKLQEIRIGGTNTRLLFNR